MSTRIERDTAEAMLTKLQGKLDALYAEQESQKTQEMKCGGKVKPKKMFGGGLTPGVMDMYNMAQQGIIGPNNPAQASASFINNMINPSPSPLGILGASPIDNTNLLGMDQMTASDFKKPRGRVGQFMDDNPNLLYNLGVASPMIYNLAQGLQKPEQMRAQDFYNPKAGRALGRLGQKYDPSQQLRQAERDYATGIRQVRSAAGGDRSALLGNQAALLDVTQRTKGDILDRTQRANMEQQNLLAQTELGVGEQMAGTNLNVDVMNAQNRAARRRHLGQSFSDLSDVLQTNRLMQNQMNRDQMLADIIPDVYKTVSQWSPWMQNIKIGE